MCHYAVDKQATPAACTQSADTHKSVHSFLHFPELHIKIQLAYVSCLKINCQDSLKETSHPPIDRGEFPSLATINKLCIQKAASDPPVFDR